MDRIKNAIIFLVIFLLEVFIALFVHDKFIRPYVGDILVVVLVYFAVRIVIPQGCRFLPLYVFLFAFLVEVLQYFHLAEVLGVADNRFLRTILGTTFDVKDIVCYAVGGLAVALYECIKKYARSKASERV